jgi:hypothetical protein
MIRSFDGERLNHLFNHPSIRPTSGGDGQSWIDASEAAADTFNHFIDGEHGGLFFHWQAPDTYETHIFVLPEGRGRWAYQLAEYGLEYMIAAGAIHLWARLPADNRQTQIFTLRAKFKPRGERVFDLGGGPTLYRLFDWRRECPQ